MLRQSVRDGAVLRRRRLRRRPVLPGQGLRSLLQFERRLPGWPVLRCEHPSVRGLELRLSDPCPVWSQRHVLPGCLPVRPVLRGYRLRRRPVLPGQGLRSLLQFERRLPGWPVLQFRHQTVHHKLCLPKRRPMWHRQVLRQPLHPGHLLCGRGLRRRQMLPGRSLRPLLQVGRGLPRHPVL